MPVFHPWIQVGRDYFGSEIMALPEYRTLEEGLNDTHPERFAEPLKRRNGEFAMTYMFSLLEACVARCARSENFDATAPEVDACVNEMLAVLGAKTYGVVCCRVVSHLTTATGAPMQIGDVTVVPETDVHGVLLRRITEEIPGAASALNRDEPRPYDPPHCLLITRETSDTADPYELSERLSEKLERFLLVVRLLTAGTVQSYYQISGPTTLVSRMQPIMDTFNKGMLGSLVRRTVRLTGDEADAFEALGSLIDAVKIERTGMAVTSFDVALGKFNGSHTPDNPFEHFVDLATALEAILAGGETYSKGLTSRLKKRAAALLATDTDSEKSVSDDVGSLYGLRSKLVHGGQIQQEELRKIIARISTVPPEASEAHFNIAIGHAVDRMRDLVRRALLARICLASEPDALWPFSGSTLVDAVLADAAKRAAWRAWWHERLVELGVEAEAGRPQPAVDFLSPEDR